MAFYCHITLFVSSEFVYFAPVPCGFQWIIILLTFT